jgi:hypothetical protein
MDQRPALSPDEETELGGDSIRKVLVIAGGSREETLGLKTCVEQRFPKARAVLLIASDREDVYRPHFAERLVLQSKRFGGIIYTTQVFVGILFDGFDAVVSVDPSPFSFAVGRSYTYLPENGRLIPSAHSYRHLYKVVVPVLLSGVVACFVTPIVFVRSFQYGARFRRSS